MPSSIDDDVIRLAAMAHCARLMREHGGVVPWAAIQEGMEVSGEHIFLGSTPKGIHRPTQMRRGVLSIKTTKPKEGRLPRYDDELGDDGYFSYAFQGSNPNSHDNTALRETFEDQAPFIYFYAIRPALYQILQPCYMNDWDPVAMRCSVAVGEVLGTKLVANRVAEAAERRYTTIEAKVRLHQAEFREIVLAAYGGRCAISKLPIPRLLDAAHIIPDRDERGRPEISNGLCLSKIHHTAFDCNLVGIDPDGVVHVSERLLDQTDGPTLEGLKASHGGRILAPRHADDRPRREYLAERFEAFKKAS